MALPTRNTQINPYPFAGEAAVQNFCAYLGPAMPSTDEAGNPLTVPVRSAYPTLWAGDVDTYETEAGQEGPSVLVSLEDEGITTIGTGMGAWYTSADGTQTVYRRKYDGCTLLLEIQGTSDPQRRYIADAVKAALDGAYLAGTFTYPFNNYVMAGMAARGVVIRSRRTRYPKAAFSEPRPFGQYYIAETRVKADITAIWAQPNTGPTSASVQVSATADMAGGGQTHTDPAQTVTPTSPPHTIP